MSDLILTLSLIKMVCGHSSKYVGVHMVHYGIHSL